MTAVPENPTQPVPVDPHVKVTMHDIYGLLLGLQNDVTELKGRTPTVTDHEARIRALEKWVWGAAGIAGIGAVVLSQVVNGLLNK
ncbi:hypothetical protein [Microbacterium sp. PRC9]|uniref:hypothetical protein n=1 Tax=Microbacterium sp. PRC9 TaxID=2962591 RepID=UPI002882382C|nr:hypothetical protein [Microbacterium sp. PRC9]MDT0142801.1 hypothetical protein [Microbacterium sp. PRC9]